MVVLATLAVMAPVSLFIAVFLRTLNTNRHSAVSVGERMKRYGYY